MSDRLPSLTPLTVELLEVAKMKQPVDHILRAALPWRTGGAAWTECGNDAADVPTITREQHVQRVKDMGQQRASLFTCMTCSQTSDRWGTWDHDPRLIMQRELEWERGGAYWHTRTDRGQRLKDELIAIASLIDAHREEFDGIVGAAESRRDWLEKKVALEHRAKSATRKL